MRGRLELRFESDGERTRMQVAEQTPPLRVIRAFELRDGAAAVHLHNVSGGVLGGDRLELRCTVGPRARAQLTTTGATRIYRAGAHASAEQRTVAHVGAGGLLEYVPDITIPFAGARYRQTTRVELEHDAGLIWWEVLAPGRLARGEAFAYEQLGFALDVTACGRPIALERALLEPSGGRLVSPARLGGYAYLATLWIARVGLLPARWPMLEQELGRIAAILSCDGLSLWGVSTLAAHGVVVRALSRSAPPLVAGLPRMWQAAKLWLYGRQAELPRKLF